MKRRYFVAEVEECPEGSSPNLSVGREFSAPWFFNKFNLASFREKSLFQKSPYGSSVEIIMLFTWFSG